MSTKITDEVHAALTARRGAWREIADKSGVSYSWISKFMNGHIPNPGTRTLMRLEEGIRAVRPSVRPSQEASHA